MRLFANIFGMTDASNKALKANILSYDRPVPRYTSYPTAPYFKDIVPSMPGAINTSNTSSESLTDSLIPNLSADEGIGLYIHVPFCPKLCWYCGCHTKITQRYAPVEDYVHLMLREIDLLGEYIPQGISVNSLHFGGGSPGMLRSCDFALLMDRLHKYMRFDDSSKIAIEIDPRNLSASRTATYAQYGVNRVSLGVQYFDDDVMASVNREQPFQLSMDAVNMFRDNGIDHFNIDLLYGLPHQNLDNMCRTIDKALLLNPDRISLFGYAHVPWMKKHMRLIDEPALPDKSLRFDLFETAAQILAQAGYIAIGIDHFAKPTDSLTRAMHNRQLHRNFQGYTTDTNQSILGIGASAIGKTPLGYIQNAIDMPTYEKMILGHKLPAKKHYFLSQDDRIRGDVIEQIMCYFEVNLNQIIAKYDLPPDYFNDDLNTLTPYIHDGLVSIDSDQQRITIPPDARAITRLVASAFDAYTSPKAHNAAATPRHARAI